MMKAPYSRLALILAGSLLAAGCKTVPVASHAINCDVNAELLASKCTPPKQIAKDATFASLVDTMQVDRQSLRECGSTVDALRDTLTRCNNATGEFNKKVDALNRTK
jgi:hypothetical protein